MAITKEQIIALIDAKIAGQGSAVDIGGALPAILKGITDLIPSSGGGGGSLEFANVVAQPEPYVSFEVFVEFGFTEDVYSKLCSGEYAGFVTENGGRYLIVATYPENADEGTPAGFAYCDNDGRVFNTEADYTNETIKIEQRDGVSVVEISSLPESGSYSAQQMADYGITQRIAQLINSGSVVGLINGSFPSDEFYGVECAYSSLDPEPGYIYTTIVLRSKDNRYEITFAENGSAVVSVESVNGGGGSAGSLCYPIGDIPVSGTSQEIEDAFGQIFTDFINSDYADESYPKFILCEDGEGNKYLIPFRITVDIDGYGSLVFEYQNKIYRVFRSENDDFGPEYRIVSSNVPVYVGPIALEEEPNSNWANITTLAGLQEVGITDSEVSQASRGFRTGLMFLNNDDANVFIPFESVSHDGAGNFGLSFRFVTNRYSINYDEGTDEVTVSITTV